MKKSPFQLLLFTLIAFSFVTASVSCSSEDDPPEESQLLEISQIVGCWKVPISDTVTEYWQFSTAVESDLEPQSRSVSIDTPSGTYINTRVTENSQNHTRVMELLAYGAYWVKELNQEIIMSDKSLYYSPNFKVTIIDNRMTLDSIPSTFPRVLVNVHYADSNNEDYAKPLPAGTCLSFGGYEISVNGDYCTFMKHPLYKGYESELNYGTGVTWIDNLGKVQSFKKTGKNTAKMTIYTSEHILTSEHVYDFDPVEIEVNLQFWGDGYGIVRGGRVIRNGKHNLVGNLDFIEYIEEEATFGNGSFGTPTW